MTTIKFHVQSVWLMFLISFIPLSSLFSQYDPKMTEVWTPVPEVVNTTSKNNIPSDAVVLFDGTNLNQWESVLGGDAGWEVKDGILTVKAGSKDIKTKMQFADCQLHIEWRTPAEIKGKSQGRGNSGIFLQERYEVQVLDSYENPTYSNGQAGSVYKQHIPMVNASRKPGEWQTYDIIFTAPRFNIDSTLKTPAYVTVIHNGVVVQHHVEIKGTTTFTGQPKYSKHNFKESLSLQDHGNPVSYRNIWVRELNVTKLFNGNDLSGWYMFLDKIGKDINQDDNFTVSNNEINILGKHFGYIATEESYSNYYLKVLFKWGDKKFPPRANARRDSGILYHFGLCEKDTVWPTSVECQIQENDCGDYWCIGTFVDSPNKWETAWNMKHIIRTSNFENPIGEWNTIEIICNGSESEHYVNGHLVNHGTNLTVNQGKILLQSEGAEVFYKSVELIPF